MFITYLRTYTSLNYFFVRGFNLRNDCKENIKMKHEEEI